MKKVLVALVIVMGLGFSVAKADEPLKKKVPESGTKRFAGRLYTY